MSEFKGRHFRGEIVLWAVRWDCRYAVSYRDLEAMIPSHGAAGALQIRRVAVEELRPLERELGEEPVGAAVNEFDRVVALERIECAGVAVDGDVAQRRGLAFHNRTPTEMGLDVGALLPNILPIVTRRS